MPENKPYNGAVQAPPNDHLCNCEDEIDLIELILPLWKNKFLLIFFALLTVGAAWVYVSRQTPQYKITAQIKPSDSIANIKSFPRNFLDAEELKGRVARSVMELYGRRNSDNPRPRVKLTNPRRSRQGVVTLFWPDRDQGKDIVARVLDNVNQRALHPGEGKTSALQMQQLRMENSLNAIRGKIKLAKVKRAKIALQIQEEKERVGLVDVEAEKLKREIENLALTQKMREKELHSLQQNSIVAQEAKTKHENNSRNLEEDTSRIISLRDQLLNTKGDDKIQLLLLSNIVQQNISYMDTIAQKITELRNNLISYQLQIEKSVEEQERLKLKIADLQDKIDRQIPARKAIIEQKIGKLSLQASQEIDNEISLLKQQLLLTQKRKAGLALIDIVRPPFASFKPAKPNLRKSLALALVLGLFLGGTVAYLRHFRLLYRKKYLQPSSINDKNHPIIKDEPGSVSPFF